MPIEKRYFESFEDAIKIWDETPKAERNGQPKPELPPKELDVTITYPALNEWKYAHKWKYMSAVMSLPNEVPPEMKIEFAAFQLIDEFKGDHWVDVPDMTQAPLYLEKFFNWVALVVFHEGYYIGRSVKKKT